MKIREKILILFIFLIFLIFLIFVYSKLAPNFSQNFAPNLESGDKGFKKIPQILEKKDVDKIMEWIREKQYKNVYQYIVNHSSVLSRIKSFSGISSEYVFQDYSYFILKSRVHTCHRDNNGTFFNPNQKYPSYTIIFYLEDIGQGLDVIPGSHLLKTPFISNSTVPIDVQIGDAILFDANLIHAGSIHPYDSIRIQMKISHPLDISTLSFYQDFHKVLNKPNTSSNYFLHLQKWFSCHFPIFSDVFMEQEDKQSWRGSETATVSWAQKIFSFFVYGDADYYDIPNI